MIRDKIKEIADNVDKFKFMKKQEWIKYKNVKVCVDTNLFWVCISKKRWFRKNINHYVDLYPQEKKFLRKIFEVKIKENKKRLKDIENNFLKSINLTKTKNNY